MLAVLISSVEKNSHAEKAGISVGESLVSINGNQIKDVLDYRFYMTDKKLEIELLKDGATRTVTLEKQEYEDQCGKFHVSSPFAIDHIAGIIKVRITGTGRMPWSCSSWAGKLPEPGRQRRMPERS